LLILLTLLTSFREADYSKISKDILRNYVKAFACPRRLMLTSQGGAMMDDVQVISLSFLSFDALDIDQARVLYVDMMEELLHRINSHEKIRSHLHNYPFEESNIELMIGFDDQNRHILGDGHVALMFIGKNNTLLYRAYDRVIEQFYSLHTEPYKEARRIVTNLRDNALQ